MVNDAPAPATCVANVFCVFWLLFSPTKRLLFNNLEFRLPINRIEIVFYLLFHAFSPACSVGFIEKWVRTSLSSRSGVSRIKYHGVAMCTFNKND